MKYVVIVDQVFHIEAASEEEAKKKAIEQIDADSAMVYPYESNV